jgi:hypothetical protein
MNESENLEPVVLNAFVQEEQVRNSSNGIEPEVEGQVVHRNALNILVSHGSFDKAEEDLNGVDDINHSLNVHKGYLVTQSRVSCIFTRPTLLLDLLSVIITCTLRNC